MKTLHIAIIVISLTIVFTNNSALAQVAPVLGQTYAHFKTDKDIYPIQYNLTSGHLGASFVDLPARALMLIVNSTSNGQLSVELPRKIIDSTRNGVDRPYFVSIGGLDSGLKRIVVDEVRTNNDVRILRINFPKGLNQIQIAGTFFVENDSSKTALNPYRMLSPLKQWRFGIDAYDVICKNDLYLVIKSNNGLPACVTSDTASKLGSRGWSSKTFTSFCFMEYLPVCGIDGITYGNLCLLNKSNTKLDHAGECDPHAKSQNIIHPTKIIVEVKDRTGTEQVFPITVTEITSNITKTSDIKSWFFLPIDRGEIIRGWNFVTNPAFEIVDRHGNNAIDRPNLKDNGLWDDVARGVEITCSNDEKIIMQFRTPTTIPIKDNVEETFGINSRIGFPPSVYKNETLRFASFFDQEIILPKHTILVSNRSETCSVDYEGFTKAYYDEIIFQLTK